MRLGYYTMSVCCTCGRDGVLLNYAAMNHVDVDVHIVTRVPDRVVDDAKAHGFDMPFFRDDDGRYYRTSSDALPKDGDGDAGVGGDVQP